MIKNTHEYLFESWLAHSKLTLKTFTSTTTKINVYFNIITIFFYFT